MARVLPLPGLFCYGFGNLDGVFCQKIPGSKSPEVQVTSISLHLSLSPFTSRPSDFSKTHTFALKCSVCPLQCLVLHWMQEHMWCKMCLYV